MTYEDALELAEQQRNELEKRGALNITLQPVQIGGVWCVDGTYDLDVEKDPIWGPIHEALKRED